MKKFVLVSLCLGILFIILWVSIYYGKYNELISSQCHIDGSVASIVWKRTLPFYLVDAYLIIKSSDGEILYKQLLMKGRDHYGDIQVEFTNISWDCNNVSLQISRNHYKGPSSITPKF